ncbi:hypothetical protein SAMN04487976_11987 [Xaviernesmea oryzae]|nr:hypothetical protein SAMN04487976_11987 [Xaviernesmea oryzae]
MGDVLELMIDSECRCCVVAAGGAKTLQEQPSVRVPQATRVAEDALDAGERR